MNEREMERLAESFERELRKFGTPYVSPEPTPQYWAGLRSGIMERVMESESRNAARSPLGWFAAAKLWAQEHLLGSSLIGVGLASAVVAALLIHPGGASHPVDQAMNQAKAQIAQSAPESANRTPAVHEFKTHAAPRTADSELAVRRAIREGESLARREGAELAANLHSPHKQKLPTMAAAMTPEDTHLANHAEEEASRPTILGTESEGPVSLNDLTADELEAVYQGLKSR